MEVEQLLVGREKLVSSGSVDQLQSVNFHDVFVLQWITLDVVKHVSTSASCQALFLGPKCWCICAGVLLFWYEFIVCIVLIVRWRLRSRLTTIIVSISTSMHTFHNVEHGLLGTLIVIFKLEMRYFLIFYSSFS